MNKKMLSLLIVSLMTLNTTHGVNPVTFVAKKVPTITAFITTAALITKHYDEIKPATQELFEKLKNTELAPQEKAKLVGTYFLNGACVVEDDFLKFTKYLIETRITQKKGEPVKTELEVIRAQQAAMLETLKMLEAQATRERCNMTEVIKETRQPNLTDEILKESLKRLATLGCDATQAQVDAFRQEETPDTPE